MNGYGKDPNAPCTCPSPDCKVGHHGAKLLWTKETIQIINKLTPDIKGKAFEPDWFLLRQRFEQIEEKLLLAERKLQEFAIEWDGKKYVFLPEGS
jgi:hypothetical protein